jgi:hypothetical protein
MNRGYVILAQNTKTTDYVKCAEVLAVSLKKVMPNCNITLISDNVSMCYAFDHVVEFPYGDLCPDSVWKLDNDWQVYEASPYEHTIKLEADMFMPNNIDYWWDVLEKRELVVCTTIRNFKQEISDVRVYRKFIDDNKLPDTYNAITYFKKSKTAEKFFAIVKDVFENWAHYKAILKCNVDEPATTDWAYAIAAHILGEENTTLPNFKEMSFIHMKQYINNLYTENWTDTFIYECLPHTLRIQTIPQMYPLHYHVKNFHSKIKEGCV